MEEWLAFTETFSLYLLHELDWRGEDLEVKSVFEEMWGLLRTGVLYFLRYEEKQHTERRIVEAQQCLLQYGRRAEEVRPRTACR